MRSIGKGLMGEGVSLKWRYNFLFKNIGEGTQAWGKGEEAQRWHTRATEDKRI